MKKRIHINKHVIARNNKTGKTDPPITVKTYKDNHKAAHIEICGPSTIIYNPDKPLNCGAKVWIETDAVVYTDREAIP